MTFAIIQLMISMIFFTETAKVAPQNEKINTYLYEVKKSIEEYGEQIRFFTNEFKNILP